MEELTFLNDKGIDGQLYAVLQSYSYPVNGETIILKAKLPAQKILCEKLGIKSTKTYRTHLNYLIEQGYVIDDASNKRYIIPNAELIYLLLPLDTVRFILDTITEPVIKIYIYLGQRYKYKPKDYTFTQNEIALHLGRNLDGNETVRRQIKNGLIALKNHGLIDYEEFYDGQVPRYRLLKWNTEFVKR